MLPWLKYCFVILAFITVRHFVALEVVYPAVFI